MNFGATSEIHEWQEDRNGHENEREGAKGGEQRRGEGEKIFNRKEHPSFAIDGDEGSNCIFVMEATRVKFEQPANGNDRKGRELKLRKLSGLGQTAPRLWFRGVIISLKC